jgi:hypothetical protein
VIDVVQNEWGDWCVAAEGRVVAVHLRWISDERTRARAEAHAARLFPDRTLRLRPLELPTRRADATGTGAAAQPPR